MKQKRKTKEINSGKLDLKVTMEEEEEEETNTGIENPIERNIIL